MALEHEELTHAILGAAVAVHRALGPGFLEAIYARALEIELAELQIPFDRELRMLVNSKRCDHSTPYTSPSCALT